MQLYRPMLKQALGITWRYKYLWFFGLFAVLLGDGGIFNLGVNNFDRVESQGIFWNDFQERISNLSLNFKFNWMDVFGGFDVWGSALLIIILGVGIFLLWLSISSQGALVYGIKQTLKNRGKIFSEALHKGASKFWPIFLLHILLNIVILIVLAIVSLPFAIIFLKTNSLIWQNILIILSFIVLVPLAIILALIVRYAVIYVVNEDVHVAVAIGNAWKLFKKNWIISLETALLLFLLNVMTGLLLVVGLVFFALPFVMLGMIANVLASNTFFWLVVVLAVLCFIVLLFLYGAIWNVFRVSVWVLLFEKIKYGDVYSRVLRWAVGLTGAKKKIEEQKN